MSSRHVGVLKLSALTAENAQGAALVSCELTARLFVISHAI